MLFLNSLAPGRFENNFQNVFFNLIPWIDTLNNSCETIFRRMPQNPSDDKSTLVQVMAWCRQATSHYLSQCCPRSLSPFGVTRPQCVNIVIFFVWNWTNAMNIWSVLWILMAWCFNTRVSVATVLSVHTCIPVVHGLIWYPCTHVFITKINEHGINTTMCHIKIWMTDMYLYSFTSCSLTFISIYWRQGCIGLSYFDDN